MGTETPRFSDAVGQDLRAVGEEQRHALESLSVQAAVAEHRRLGSLGNQH